jgi:hypothetical protein
MKFGNFSLANLAAAEKAIAADTLYFPYPGWPFGYLGGPTTTQLPVAVNSVSALIQNFNMSNSNPGGWLYIPSYITSVPVANAFVLMAYYGGNEQATLFMSPAFSASWASLCFAAMGATNCPSPGPVVPANSPQLQGVQYIAVMPDNRKPPSFANCTINGSALGKNLGVYPLSGVTPSKNRGPKSGSYKLDG